MKLTSLYLAATLALGSTSTTAHATEHLIPAADLRTALTAQSAQRAAHIAEIQTLLRQEGVRARLGDLAKVETLIANLDDEILSDLGARSRQVNAEIVADGSGTWIAIGAVAAVGITVAILLAIRLGNE